MSTDTNNVVELTRTPEPLEELVLLSPDDVELEWARVRGFLMRGSLEWDAHYSIKDMFLGLLSGAFHAMYASKNGTPYGMILVQLSDFPKIRIARVVYAAGQDPQLMVRLLPQIEAWASLMGATRVEITGRKPWERLTGDDYIRENVILVKEVKPIGPGPGSAPLPAS